MKRVFLTICLIFIFPAIALGSSHDLDSSASIPLVRFSLHGVSHYVLGTTHVAKLPTDFPKGPLEADILYQEHDGWGPDGDNKVFPKGKNHDAVLDALPDFSSSVLKRVQELAEIISVDVSIVLSILEGLFRDHSSEYDDGMDDLIKGMFEKKESTIGYLEPAFLQSLDFLTLVPLLSYAILEDPEFVQALFQGDCDFSGSEASMDYESLLNLNWLTLYRDIVLDSWRFKRNHIMAQSWLKRDNKTGSSLIAVGQNHLLLNYGIIAILMREMPDVVFELWQGGDSWSAIAPETPWVYKGIDDIEPKEIRDIMKEVRAAVETCIPISTERMKALALLWIAKAKEEAREKIAAGGATAAASSGGGGAASGGGAGSAGGH